MQVLKHLEPQKVFSFFESMCTIPHGSGNTKAISDWCVAFAKERGLEHYQDTKNNVIIIKEAAPGYEKASNPSGTSGYGLCKASGLHQGYG